VSKENGKPVLVKTPRIEKPTGVFARIAAADKKSGVSDRVRQTSSENGEKC
jgi:hypothetical protein